MSVNEQFERDFESFLKDDDSRLAALYRKLPRPEPDAQLDAAVLAIARRAAAASKPKLHRPRWLPALSAVAVIALAIGIGFRVAPKVWQKQGTTTLQKTLDESPAPASEPPPASPPVSTETARQADLDRHREKDAAAETANAAKPPPAPAPAAAPATVTGYAAPIQQAQLRPQVRKVESAAKRTETSPPQAFPTQAAREQEQKAAAPVASEAAADAAQAIGTTPPKPMEPRDDQTEARKPVSAPPLREESAPAPAEVPAGAAAPPPPPVAEKRAAGGAAAESMLAAPAPAAKAARLAPQRSQDPNAGLYPEHWLANIRTMLRENRRDEALRSLAEFRKKYPSYHLPDDLRALK